MKLTYNVQDRPSFGKTLVFALQQLLAILAATIAVPAIVGNGMSQSAALFGAGVGTLVYLLFTKFKSPVFLGSSFAFLGSMFTAFAGAYANTTVGYVGLILGALFAGLVYVIIAVIVKFAGVKWIGKIMPAVVIGPTVAIIGLSLAGNAVANSFGFANPQSGYPINTTSGISFICALITLGTVVICSVYGKKLMKMIPFIIGIVAGYLAATIFTLIGIATKNPNLQIIDFTAFTRMQWIPEFTFIKAISGLSGELLEDGTTVSVTGEYILGIAIAYVPVAFVVFAEHIADHKNLSSIIEHDLLEDPGLSNTLLGDGVGSMAGAFFGGCPNTTYGESVGCVAISGNASVTTILYTSIMAILASFVAPFVTFLATIPTCVMGGVCITLYGFIAVSGLKMIQSADLGDNRNLFVVSVVLIAGVGGMKMLFGEKQITITAVAAALILGIITNIILSRKKDEPKAEDKPEAEDKPAEEKVEAEKAE